MAASRELAGAPAFWKENREEAEEATEEEYTTDGITDVLYGHMSIYIHELFAIQQ